MSKFGRFSVGGNRKRDEFEEEEEDELGPLVFNPVSTSKASLVSSRLLVPTVFGHGNCLQFLRCPGTDSFVLFFPTGANSRCVGFLHCSLRSSGDISSVGCSLDQPIRSVSVSPDSSSSAIGYLSASTLNSVDWFVVKPGNPPTLLLVGSKIFNSLVVVRVCWSPHLPQECIVLLDSGDLFLYDLGRDEPTGVVLRPPWDGCGQNKWVSLEFGWHPRVLVVARSDAVFVADFRSFNSPVVTCVARIDETRLAPDERFLSMAKVGSGGYQFALASNTVLFLFDVNSPFTPLVQWAHEFRDHSYIEVFRLADLRANSRSDMYDRASESGFCIVLGSFLSSRFIRFVFGPSSATQSGKFVPLGGAEFAKDLCSWDCHSELLLSGCVCRCESCLVREEISKDTIPSWLEWQDKKELVLGFTIVDKDLSEPDEFGGFTLVRLMSSGKLESQRYSASWDTLKRCEESHDKAPKFDDYLMRYAPDKNELPRRFSYLEFSFLNGHLVFKLNKAIDSKLKNHSKINAKSRAKSPKAATVSFTQEFHEMLCEKLSVCGLSRARTSPLESLVFKDISSPLTIHEVALKRMWANFPVEILQLAFSHYSEFHVLEDAALEFLAVPDIPRQLPPFIYRNPSKRSNKWSQKVPCTDDDLVGPVLPLPVLLELQELHFGHDDLFSVESEHKLRCDEVLKMARETAVSETGDDFCVSLADDKEDMRVGSQTAKQFVLHKPLAFSSCDDHDDSRVFGTLISRVTKKGSINQDHVELFDSLCPINLKFDNSSVVDLGTKELKAFKLLNRQFSKWQKDFPLNPGFCCKSKSKT